MLLDRRDLSFIRLAGIYRWLPYDIGKFGFDDIPRSLSNFIKTGYFRLSRGKDYLTPTPLLYDVIKNNKYDFDTGTKQAYDGCTTLRRRLEASEVMFTCLRAGIDVFQDHSDSLQHQPVFFPAFYLRNSDSKLMNASNCIGFGHWGNTAYILQYVSAESIGMYQKPELTLLNNLLSVFDTGLNTPQALLLAGSSYYQVYKQITDTTPSSRHGKKSFNDFWDVYRTIDMPVHLLSCDEVGAMQLKLMSQPDYNTKLANAAFYGYGDKWDPVDGEIPEADGKYEGNPMVIACDMNIRRVNRVCASARSLGRSGVYVAAFEGQIPDLTNMLPTDIKITRCKIDTSTYKKAFSETLSLNDLDSSISATGRKGVVLRV